MKTILSLANFGGGWNGGNPVDLDSGGISLNLIRLTRYSVLGISWFLSFSPCEVCDRTFQLARNDSS